MKRAFSALTALSLRFRLITIVLAVAVSAAGIIAVTQLKQELIPSISFPQTIILAQASGMTGEQVLNVVSKRLEEAIQTVPEVVNVESTTTGAFGAVITARNNFGQNQALVRASIESALDQVWFPVRRIQPPEGEDAGAFAARLLADLPADTLIWLAEGDSTFLFQLSPQVWSALSPETTEGVLAYLALQTESSGSAESGLRSLVENELVPLLESVDQVASVQVSGGQLLPDENGLMPTSASASDEGQTESLLLGLTPDVWSIVSDKVPSLNGVALDEAAVAALQTVAFTIPEDAPALPESWQIDRFANARDLREMRTLTRSVGAVINNFAETGAIVGAIGQTNDLTADVVQQMLTVDPTLVEYFEADHLAAMPADAFAALPAEFLASLDGFTRDALAAKAIAVAVTGSGAEPEPVDLPQAWRIQPPQLIQFSFDDIPLASFSIAGTSTEAAAVASANTTVEASSDDPAPTAMPSATDDPVAEIPEGPPMPALMALIGTFIGAELNTADDLINLELSGDLAEQFGGSSLRAADLLNFLMLLGDPDALPEGTPSLPIPGGAGTIVGAISPDAFSFIAQYDETFAPSLSAQVYDVLSDEVLAQPAAQPPLDQVWATLAGQP
ncbi:MAG: efflux RND transporter permease subunit [Chloroflexi bacterium]|nr:efflux RND transporter permease subunit [Chloroflexota bacterium]